MKALAAALVEAQKEMPAVRPDARNPHFGNDFVSLDHLIASTKPTLTKNGLAILQFPATVEGAPGLTTTLIHAASGESLSDTSPLILAKQDMQGLGGALTYMRRYAWASVLGISAEGDDDGNAASAPGTGASQASASTVGGAADGGAGSSTPTSGSPAPPTTGDSGDWVWETGKHKGTALKDTELDYVVWYSTNGPKADVKQRCLDFLGGSVSDDDIPF